MVDSCNLAIRFLKNNKKTPNQYYFVVQKVLNSYKIKGIDASKTIENSPPGFNIECTPKTLFAFTSFEDFQKSYIKLNIAYDHKKSPWDDISKDSSENLLKFFNQESKDLIVKSRMDDKYSPGFIFLKTKNMFYGISGANNNKENLERITGIQFNSLAPSTSSIKFEVGATK